MSEKIASVTSLEDHKFDKELPALMHEAAAPQPIPKDMADRLQAAATAEVEKNRTDNVIKLPEPKKD